MVRGAYSRIFKFKRPVDLEIPSGAVSVSSLVFDFKISGWWLAKRIEIDATNGLYDWIQRAVHLGAGASTINYKDVPLGDPKDGLPSPGTKMIQCPPNLDDMIQWTSTGNGLRIYPMVLWQHIEDVDPAPELSALVVDDDLDPFARDLPREAYYSQRPTRRKRRRLC